MFVNGQQITTQSFVSRLLGVKTESGLVMSLLEKIADHQKCPPGFFHLYKGRNYADKKHIPYQLGVQILEYFYFKGIFTEDGCKIINKPVPIKEKPISQKPNKETLEIKKPEKRLQIKLAKELKGSIEVSTEAGRIDLLTPTEIIEIKQIGQWKSALGQILVYGYYYPSHQKRIYLFGVGGCHSSYLDTIKKHCKKFNVTVTVDFACE